MHRRPFAQLGPDLPPVHLHAAARARPGSARRRSRGNAHARSRAAARAAPAGRAGRRPPFVTSPGAGRRACGSHSPGGSDRSASTEFSPRCSRYVDRLRARLQRLVIEVEHLAHERRIVDRFCVLRLRRQRGERDRRRAARRCPPPSRTRSSSTACRKLTRSVRITQSIALPPAWHAPRQCQSCFARRHHQLGPWSSWKGHRPITFAPCRRSSTPRGLHQRHQIRLPLDPLQLCVRDPRHSEILSRGWSSQ